MQCTQTQFMGKKVELEYRFNSDGLSDMSTVKGDIYIETNIGEYNLPFVVSVLNVAGKFHRLVPYETCFILQILQGQILSRHISFLLQENLKISTWNRTRDVLQHVI